MQETKEISSRKKGKLPLVLTLGALLILGLAVLIFPEVREFLSDSWAVLSSGDEETIREWVLNFGPYGPLIIIMAMVAQMFLVVIPSLLLLMAAILAYGPIWGSLINLVAVGIASTVGYSIGKLLGEKTLRRLIGRDTQRKISDFLKNYGFWAVFVIRLNPFLSNDAISFMGGFLTMGYPRFIGATILGISPLILVLALLNESSGPWRYALFGISVAGFLMLAIYIRKQDKSYRTKDR